MSVDLPQFIIIVWLVTSILVSILDHGRMRPASRYNAVNGILKVATLAILLYWVGFFA